MKKYSRRKAIATLAAGGAGFTLLNHARAENLGTMEFQTSATTSMTPAFRGQHQPKPLPFDPAKLKGISEKLIRSHWENNYGGAVKALNAVELRLGIMVKVKDLPAYMYGDLKREEALRTGSIVLHENYFANLGGDNTPGGKGLDLIKQWFGSYDDWEADFKKTANALGGGSGWVTLTHNLYTGEVHNYWSWDHLHNAPMGRPLIVLDMYEHAYHMDYGAAAAKYIDAFVQNINWAEVNRRAEASIKANIA